MVAGLTDGFDDVELNPEGLLAQVYVLPATDAAPMEIEAPLQILELAMTAAAGRELMVTVTEFDFAHPVAVMVSVSV